MGTVFCIELPVTRAEAEEYNYVNDTQKGPVADDEIDYLRSHIMFLETRGYSVTPVHSGDDAIHLIHQDPKAFDIVLLDEQMVGKDGLSTLDEIKEFLPTSRS